MHTGPGGLSPTRNLIVLLCALLLAACQNSSRGVPVISDPSTSGNATAAISPALLTQVAAEMIAEATAAATVTVSTTTTVAESVSQLPADASTAAPTRFLSTPAPLPEEHYITGILGHKQYFPLGCEAASAKDWANFFGFDFNEFEFQYRLPKSDNPDLGFVGSVDAPWGQVPPYGYGVHAGPVADLLNAYGIPAKAYKNYSMDQVVANLAQDRPVIAWVIGNVVGGVPYEYTDAQGQTVTVAAYEHVIILTGYSVDKIRYMNNGKFYDVPREVFLNSWGVLGNMAITVD